VKVLDFRGVSRSWLEDFRSSLLVTTENSLAFLQEAGRSVSLGAQADESNVRSDFCRAEGIPIIRNIMPHGAVGYHDSGEFRLCAAINNTSYGIRHLYKVAATALDFLSINADFEGNNILVSGKKIGTITTPRFDSVTLFNVHILLDWDIDTAEKAIISPRHDMREHIRTLKELGKGVSFDELRDAFKESFQQVFGEMMEGELPAPELVDGVKASIEELHPKYRSETWLKLGKWSPVKDYWRPE